MIRIISRSCCCMLLPSLAALPPIREVSFPFYAPDSKNNRTHPLDAVQNFYTVHTGRLPVARVCPVCQEFVVGIIPNIPLGVQCVTWVPPFYSDKISKSSLLDFFWIIICPPSISGTSHLDHPDESRYWPWLWSPLWGARHKNATLDYTCITCTTCIAPLEWG